MHFQKDEFVFQVPEAAMPGTQVLLPLSSPPSLLSVLLDRATEPGSRILAHTPHGPIKFTVPQGAKEGDTLFIPVVDR
jgi:hypothetical protein